MTTKLLLHLDHDIKDYSNNNIPFTSIQTPLYAAGAFGNAMSSCTSNRFPHTTQNPFAGIGAGDFTVEFWLKIKSSSNTRQVIFSSNQTDIPNSSNPIVNCYYDPSGFINARSEHIGCIVFNIDGTQIKHPVMSDGWVNGVEHCRLAFVRKDGFLHYYQGNNYGLELNSVNYSRPALIFPSSYSFKETTNYFRVGFDNNIVGGGAFEGNIQEFRISNTAIYTNSHYGPYNQPFTVEVAPPTSFLVNGISGLAKGATTSLTLDKSIIMALPSVIADSYFSQLVNIEKAIIVYTSTNGNQEKELVFDMNKTTPDCKVIFTNICKNNFNISKIILKDFDNVFFIVDSTDIPSLPINL